MILRKSLKIDIQKFLSQYIILWILHISRELSCLPIEEIKKAIRNESSR